MQLRIWHAHAEFVDQVEGEIAADARHVDEFGEDQQDENGERRLHPSRRQRLGQMQMAVMAGADGAVLGVPLPHAPQDDDRQQRREREERHALALSRADR